MPEKTVPSRHAGMRVDKGVSDLTGLSRNQVKRLIGRGDLLVNGVPTKPSITLKAGDVVSYTLKAPTPLAPRAVPLEVLYEDDACLVVNKPSGLLVHPASTRDEVTLVHAVYERFQDIDGFDDPERLGIVHRLDKDTSGLLVIARTPEALKILQDEMRARRIKRSYLALVEGCVPHAQGKVDAPIGRNKRARHKLDVTGDGRRSVTHFEVVERFKAHTLLSCTLETGRTHQIRVHMQYIGHPLVGDALYGRTAAARGQYLHAFSLAFSHPTTQETMHFKRMPPHFFTRHLKRLAG